MLAATLCISALAFCNVWVILKEREMSTARIVLMVAEFGLRSGGGFERGPLV